MERAESRRKTARTKLTAGMTDQQVLDLANKTHAQNEELIKNHTADSHAAIAVNLHKVQFLHEALHDRDYEKDLGKPAG